MFVVRNSLVSLSPKGSLIIRLCLVVPLAVLVWVEIYEPFGVPSLRRVVEVDRRLLGFLPCSLRGPGSRLGILRQGGPCLGPSGLGCGELLVLKDDSATDAFCLTGESFGFVG